MVVWSGVRRRHIRWIMPQIGERWCILHSELFGTSIACVDCNKDAVYIGFPSCYFPYSTPLGDRGGSVFIFEQ